MTRATPGLSDPAMRTLTQAVANSTPPGRLDTRETLILAMRYGLLRDGKCHTVTNIARTLSMSRSRIYQLLRAAHTKLHEDQDMRKR